MLKNLFVQKLMELNIFTLPLKFVEKTHNYEITLDDTIDDQDKLEKLIFGLSNYKAKNKKKKSRREK